MNLYDYIYKESKRGGKSLILIIDLNEFNNVSIHIDDLEEIKYFMFLISSDNDIKVKNSDITAYLEEIYHNEIDPHSRGAN